MQYAPKFPALGEAIRRFCAPLLFVEELSENKLRAIGGTALFLETPKGRFLVTAFHVWKALKAESTLPGGRMCIAVPVGKKFLSLLDADVVSEDEQQDIIVLSSPRLTEAKLEAKTFYRPTRWPLPETKSGETVGFIGYPGQIRGIKGMELDPGSWYLECPCIAGREGTYLIPGKGLGEERQQVNHVPSPPSITDVGGTSGAPVFAWRSKQPTLMGIVTGGTEGAGLQSTFQVSSTQRLSIDGMIA